MWLQQKIKEVEQLSMPAENQSLSSDSDLLKKSKDYKEITIAGIVITIIIILFIIITTLN